MDTFNLKPGKWVNGLCWAQSWEFFHYSCSEGTHCRCRHWHLVSDDGTVTYTLFLSPQSKQYVIQYCMFKCSQWNSNSSEDDGAGMLFVHFCYSYFFTSKYESKRHWDTVTRVCVCMSVYALCGAWVVLVWVGGGCIKLVSPMSIQAAAHLHTSRHAMCLPFITASTPPALPVYVYYPLDPISKAGCSLLQQYSNLLQPPIAVTQW